MTLDEAIKHAQEIADKGCDQCAKDHQQLADWLTELKQRKEKSIVDMAQIIVCRIIVFALALYGYCCLKEGEEKNKNKK